MTLQVEDLSNDTKNFETIEYQKSNAVFLGCTVHHDRREKSYPLLILRNLLRQESDYLDPIKHHFDAFGNNVVAPDHLLVGLTRNTLRVLLTSLEVKPGKLALNSIFAQALRRNDLPREKYIWNVSKGRDGELNTTSFKNTFAIFQLAQVVVQQFNLFFSCSSLKILSLILPLACFIELSPSSDFSQKKIDGHILIDFVFGSQREIITAFFKGFVVTLSTKYIPCFRPKTVILHQSWMFRNCIVFSCLLITPFQKYGHCRLFSDSLFETKHQPLTKQILQDKYSRNRVYALEPDVMEQWKSGVAKSILKLRDSDITVSDRKSEEFQLHQLLLEFDTSNRIANGFSEMKRRAEDVLEKLQNSLVVLELL